MHRELSLLDRWLVTVLIRVWCFFYFLKKWFFIIFPLFCYLLTGIRHVHLSIHHSAFDPVRHRAWPQFERTVKQSVSCECRSSSNSRKEMVYGAEYHCDVGWHSTVWIHFHWNVFHFHIILGIQNLLCLRIHAARLPYLGHCHGVCDDCLHLFPTQCWRLQMVSVDLMVTLGVDF